MAQTVAVTGGTGGYAGATGTITAEEHATDTEYYQDWTFDISLP